MKKARFQTLAYTEKPVLMELGNIMREKMIELHPYQKRALERLYRRKMWSLGLEPKTGKTAMINSTLYGKHAESAILDEHADNIRLARIMNLQYTETRCEKTGMYERVVNWLKDIT